MAGKNSIYSWEDFNAALDEAGLRGQFSEADLRLAQSNPDVGMSLLGYKKQWNSTTDEQERLRLNEAANALRSSYGGYTGGGNGGSFIKDTMAPRDFSYDEFSFSREAPTYNNRYDGKIQELLGAVTDREDFSYNAETDPLYSQYRKQYIREGQRATQDAMGQAAAMSGGLPSSYASSAAGQAANYYNAQLTDKIPELEELAYQKYVNDFDMDRAKLSAAQGAEQADYQKYLNDLGQYNTDREFAYNQYSADRNFAYNQYLDELERQRYDDKTAYERDWAQNERDYQRGRDALEDQRYADETAYQREQDARARALQEALTGAEFGDYSGLAGLGFDTSQYQSAEELQRAIQEAEFYAGYGDFSRLRDMGIDTAWLEQQWAAEHPVYGEDMGTGLGAGLTVNGLGSTGIGSHEQSIIRQAQKAYDDLQKEKAAAKESGTETAADKSKSSGGSGGNRSSGGTKSTGGNTGTSGPDYEGLYRDAQKSPNPPNYIASHYKEYGFTHSTGLSSGYTDWAKTNPVAGDGLSFSANKGMREKIVTQLEMNEPEAALMTLNAKWLQMNETQRRQMSELLQSYGYTYTYGG